MPTSIDKTMQTDADDVGVIYLEWLKSGHVYAIRDVNEERTVRAISKHELVHTLDRAHDISQIKYTDTPFSTWEFPDKAIKILIKSHTNAYALPVTDDTILTAYRDTSLKHGVNTPTQLQNIVKRNNVNHMLIEETPFKRNISAEI
jgi:hypothetical protein